MGGWYYGDVGWVRIGIDEVMIWVTGKGKYEAWSDCRGFTMNIMKDAKGINAITKVDDGSIVYFNKLEVYA